MSTEEARRKRAAYERRRRKKKKKRTVQMIRRGLLFMAGFLLGLFSFWQIGNRIKTEPKKGEQPVMAAASTKKVANAPEFDVRLLTPNPYSRSQISMEQVKGIVIHYTANPGTTAQQNRDYFEGLKDTKQTKVSSHFVVGLEGEIVQCIPSTEISYASNDRNIDTLSIECCHYDETGKFSDSTYQSLVHLTAWLCGNFELTTEDIMRHYDVTGKKCPLYYVENEDEWEKFKQDVQKYIDTYGVEEEINLGQIVNNNDTGQVVMK